MVKQQTGPEDEKNLDGKALCQFFRRHDKDSSESETQKDIRGNCQIGESIWGNPCPDK
jgi:hypothetical protein